MTNISITKLINGLYYLQDSPLDIVHFDNNVCINFVTFKIILESSLWHFRLAHVPNNCIKVLNNHFPYVSCDKHICDVYYYSKKKKLPYATSNNNFDSLFYLIHSDIGGTFLYST